MTDETKEDSIDNTSEPQAVDPLEKLMEISKQLELLQKLNERLESEYVQAQTNLQNLQGKYTKLANDYAGLQADYQGAIGRHADAVKNASKFAVADFALILLSAVDMIEMSIKLAKPMPDIANGLGLVLEKILGNIQMKGIAKVPCEIGSTPDPTLHCVVKQEESPDQPAGSIVSVIQDGYMLHERLLRPTSVVVAANVEVTI